MCVPDEHPEIKVLRSQCKQLRGQLKDAVDTWHTMVTVERPRLMALYDAAFREEERTYQELAIQAAEISRRVELLSIKVARGEALTKDAVELVNQVVDKEFSRYRQRIAEAFAPQSTDATNKDGSSTSGSGEDDRDLVSMFRTLAKQLHPDSTEGEGDIEAWHRVQNAYKEKDLSRLSALYKTLGVDEDTSATSAWSVEQWRAEASNLHSRLGMELRKLSRLQAEEPFTIAENLEQEQWIEQRHKEMEKRNQDLERTISTKTSLYKELTGGDVPQSSVARSSQAQMDLDRDFMENTYFGNR